MSNHTGKTPCVPQAISLHVGGECFFSTIKHSLTTKGALLVQLALFNQKSALLLE